MFAKSIIIYSSLSPLACGALIEKNIPKTHKFSCLNWAEGIYLYEIEPVNSASTVMHYSGCITGRIKVCKDGTSEIMAETEPPVSEFGAFWQSFGIVALLLVIPHFISGLELVFIAVLIMIAAADVLGWVLAAKRGLEGFEAIFSCKRNEE